MGNRCADHVTPLYPQKFALTSPTGGGRSVGIVRSRTKATEFSLLYNVGYKFLKPTHAPIHQPTHTTEHTHTHLEIWPTNFEECDKKILSANSTRSLQPYSTLHSTDVSMLIEMHVYNSSCFHQFALVSPPLCSLLPTVNHSLFRSLVFWRQSLIKIGQSTRNYESYIIYPQITTKVKDPVMSDRYFSSTERVNCI